MLPLRAHALLMLSVLVGLAFWIGPDSSFTSDEGASVLQAQAIAHGHWTVPDPMASVDPGSHHYPVVLSAHGTQGYAPLGKHLFYGVALAGVDRFLGVRGMVGLSILGTFAAALLAAALSRSLRPGLERTALWFVGLGTPLTFDGFLLVGQAVAAAAVAASALLALRFVVRGGRLRLAGVTITCGMACLLRTEAVLWCTGLAVAAVVMRPLLVQKYRATWLAGITLSAAIGSHEIDVVLTRWALGGHQSFLSGGPSGDHGPGAQLHAAFISLFQAGSNQYSISGAALVVVLALMAVTARLLKRGRASQPGLTVVALLVVGLWTLRLFSAPDDPISGLAVAAPVLWVGLWLLDRSYLATKTGRMSIVALAVFAILVLVSQYPDGGGLQWGGRFFAVALPVACPVALESLRRVGPRLGRRTAAGLLAGCVVATSVVSIGAIGTLHSHHRLAGALADAISSTAPKDPGDGGRPVVITSEPDLPRLEWRVFDRVRWQVVPLKDMAAVGRNLRRHGIEAFLLVSADPVFDTTLLSGSFRSTARTGSIVAGTYLIPLRAD